MINTRISFLSIVCAAGAFFCLTGAYSQENLSWQERYEAALLFKESGQYRQAIDILTKNESLLSNKIPVRGLCHLYSLENEFEKALECFDRITDKNWLDLLYLGLLFEESGDEQKAVKYYRRSFDLRPGTIALLRLGKIYRKQKRYTKAAETFGEVIRLDSSIRLAYYYKGQCLLADGKYADAFSFLSKAKNFYPRRKGVQENIQEARDRLGEDYFESRQKDIEEERKSIKLSAYQPDKDMPLVRVGLAEGLDRLSFSCGGPFIASDGDTTFKGKANIFYRLSFEGKRLLLENRNDPVDKKYFSPPLSLSSIPFKGKLYPFYILDLTYGENSFWEKKIDRAYRGKLEIAANNSKMTLINIVSTEEYLYGVLSAEIPSSSPAEALGAQAVAARTLAYRNRGRHRRQGFDFCADVHCQVYQGLSAETPATSAAVDKTRGIVLFHEDNLIESFYHSNSGGCLASDVFGRSPYLEEKIDFSSGGLPQTLADKEKWFIEIPETFSTSTKGSSFRWQKVYDSEDFLLTFEFPLDELQAIITRDEGECFHHKQLDIVTNNKTYTLNGDLKIRTFLGGLRSSAFKMAFKKNASGKISKLLFWGAGFGHGAGMSQEGAINMAKDGRDHRQILTHYYPLAVFRKISR
jgi:stage II sporulation protein D